MSTTSNYIPKYTDEPEMFLFCSVQELTVGAFFFLGFAWVGHELTAIAAFVLVIGLMRRMKKTLFKDGYEAFLYWHLPEMTPLDKYLPKSCNREYLG